MKILYTTILLILTLTITGFAQSPEKLSYQAVIRDASNNLIVNQNVGMQISILQGSITGTSVYVETQSPASNDNGLISIEIGTGSLVSGDLASIDWSNGPYFIETQVDPSGGTNYTITGASEFLSVPYSFHAKTADSLIGGITVVEVDPVFSASPAGSIIGADIISWDNKLDTEVDGSITNELQNISLSNDTIFLSNGGFAVLPVGFSGQYSGLIGAPTNVSFFTNDAGYLTTEIDGSVTNEIQALSISNDTVYLSNGGFVKLPAGFDGQYSSLTGAPTNVSSFTNDAGYLTTEVDGSVTNELQVLSISGNVITLTNGGTVTLPAGFDGQYSSLTGAPTNVSSFTNDAGYLTTEVDGSVTNELQVLSISGNVITLTNGGMVTLPAGFDGQYSSLTGAPTNVSSFTNDAGYLTTEVDGSVTNELQAISLNGDSLVLSNGGFVDLSAYAIDNVADGDTSDSNELQNISIVGDSVFLSSGGAILLPNDNDWIENTSGDIYSNTLVGIGTTTPDKKLHVVEFNNLVTAAISAEGAFGPTLGQMGVQGQLDHEGIVGLNLTGQEIGLLGVSIGGSATDNSGVLGIANGWGGTFQHSSSGNLVTLGGATSAIRIVDGNQAVGRVLTSDASGNATWQIPSGGGGGGIWTPVTGSNYFELPLSTPQDALIIGGNTDFGGLAFGTLQQGVFWGSGFDVGGNNTVEDCGMFTNSDIVLLMSPGDNNLIQFWEEDAHIEVANIAQSGAYFQTSDMTAKQNIVKLDNALDIVKNLNGYTYEFIQSPEDIEKETPMERGVGVMAQELENVLPQLVNVTDQGRHLVNYAGLTPVLIESIKEQQAIINQQKDDNEALQTIVNDLLNRIERLEAQ